MPQATEIEQILQRNPNSSGQAKPGSIESIIAPYYIKPINSMIADKIMKIVSGMKTFDEWLAVLLQLAKIYQNLNDERGSAQSGLSAQSKSQQMIIYVAEYIVLELKQHHKFPEALNKLEEIDTHLNQQFKDSFANGNSFNVAVFIEDLGGIRSQLSFIASILQKIEGDERNQLSRYLYNKAPKN